MFVYFNFLNYNESIFYTLIKVIIHHLINLTQRTNNKHNKTNFNIDLYLLNHNICWMVVKKYSWQLH